MQALTIEEVKTFIDGDPVSHQYLTKLIHHSIANKKLSFLKEEFKSEYEHLSKVGFVKAEYETAFTLDFSLLVVCCVLTEIAEDLMKEKVEVEPVAALSFANRFAAMIREPKPRTFWYSDLEMKLESYQLIWLHQVHGIDITSFIDSITDEMKDNNPDLRGIDMTYKYVFPYLNDEIEKQYGKITAMLGDVRTKDSALDAVKDIGQINTGKAMALYQYAKEHGAIKQEGLLSHFLKGLYPTNEGHYLNEAMEMMKESALESLLAISWLDYKDEKQIAIAFDFIRQQSVEDIEYRRILPNFYTRLIGNESTPEEIKVECFKMIEQLADADDPQLRGNLVWRTGMIKGRDKEKYELLPKFMAWGDPSFLNDYFTYFDSPESLFTLIRQSFIQYGMSTNLDLFDRAISGQYHQNKEKFSQELLKLLSDDLAIVRFAGIRVMTSRHGGSYEVNFLDMQEKGQLRVIEALLPSPTNIEELMPLIMILRKSPHASVRGKLESELIDLIRAYDHHLIDMAKIHLDLTIEDDKKLHNSLTNAYENYKEIKETRLLIKELNPIENELRHVDFYFQLEHENTAEMMDRINAEGIFGQMAKHTSIIRGSGFNSESNQKIALLGEVGTSRLIDQRHSINPDAYEWNFKMNAMAKNYNDQAEP